MQSSYYFKTQALAASSLVFIAACDSGQAPLSQNRAVNPQSRISVPLEVGTQYKWYRDSSCTNGEREVCVTHEDYKALCLSASGASVLATGTLSIYNQRANFLVNNGDIDEISLKWKEGYAYGCRMTMQVSGIYRGSSARESLEGGVSSFIFNQDGKILALSTSEMNN